MFDMEPDGDLHGECAFEIHRLEEEVSRLSVYESECERAAEVLQKALPIGGIKAIGLREVAAAVEEIERLRLLHSETLDDTADDAADDAKEIKRLKSDNATLRQLLDDVVRTFAACPSMDNDDQQHEAERFRAMCRAVIAAQAYRKQSEPVYPQPDPATSNRCDHPWHRNPGLTIPCPECGAIYHEEDQ
jgi:hypothetical protein